MNIFSCYVDGHLVCVLLTARHMSSEIRQAVDTERAFSCQNGSHLHRNAT